MLSLNVHNRSQHLVEFDGHNYSRSVKARDDCATREKPLITFGIKEEQLEIDRAVGLKLLLSNFCVVSGD